MIKRFLFLLLMLSIPVFAGSDYFITVSSSEEVDWYWTVFNAIPMILGSDSYMTLLRLVFLMGGFLVLAQMVLNAGKDAQGGLINFTKFHILGMAVLTLAFSDHSTVIIKAEYPTTYYNSYYNAPSGIAIDNIPTPLAFAFKFFNSMGRETVGLFEQAFSSVSPVPGQELGGAYSAQKYGYGSSLRNNLKLLNMDMDGALGMALDEFFSDCVYIPYSSKGMDGQVHLEEISNSDNIIYLMGQWINAGETIGGVPAGDYTGYRGGELMTCKDFYNQLTTIDIAQFLAKDHSLATNPLDPLGKMTEQDMGMLLKSRAVPSSDFQQIALQAGVMNSIARNDSLPTGVVYAAGKQRADFNLNNISQGYYLSEMLPVMQMMLRGLLYAIFPFILVVTLLPGGLKVIGQYGQTMLWVESWGVLAAILNHVICKYTEVTVGGGLTLNNSAEIMGTTASMAGLAGYLYASLPALSWLLLKGSGTMLGNISGGLSASFAKNASTASIAADRKAQASQEQVSKDLGREVSMAEAMHYQSVASGIKEGANVAVDKNAGNNKVGDKAKYDASIPYANYDEKLKVLNASKPSELVEFEKTMTGNNTAKDKALVENTTRPDFANAGISEANEKKANSKMIETFGSNNLLDNKIFDSLKTNLSTLSEKDVRQKNPLGVEGSIVAEKTLETGTNLSTLNKNMSSTGNDIDKISDIMSSSNNFELGKKEGYTNNTSYVQNKGAGTYSAASTNAQDTTITNNGVSSVQKNEEYKQQNDIWANQAAATMQTSLGGIKQNVQDNAKVKVIDDKANAMASDNNGNGTLSKNDLKDRLATQTTEQQANFEVTKAKQKIDAGLLADKLAEDPLFKKGAGKVKSSNLGSEIAKSRAGSHQVSEKNKIRDEGVNTKHQRIDKESGITSSDIALSKSSEQAEKINQTLNSTSLKQEAINDDVNKNYKDVYNQNLEKAKEQGLTGAAAREQAALQTEKDFGNINIGKNNKEIYDSRLQQGAEKIKTERASLTKNGDLGATLKQQQEALNHYKQNGGHDKTVLANFSKNIGQTQSKINRLNSLEKEEKNLKRDVQQDMVKEKRATISGGKMHFNDFKSAVEGQDKEKETMSTSIATGVKASRKVETQTSAGKTEIRQEDSTSKVNNVSRTTNVGDGTNFVGGTDPLAHLNKAGHQEAADNIATGEKYVDKASKIVDTVLIPKKVAKAFTKKK